MSVTIEKNLGAITAYGLAKEAGYTGTKQEFVTGLVESATAAATATQKATEATQAKNDAVSAKNSAVSAKDDAVTAKNAAVGAKDDALTYKTQTQALHDSILTLVQIPVGHAYNIGITESNNVINIIFTDPKDNVNAEGATLAYWQKTRILYKTGGFPENENDGTVLLDNTVRNAYRDTPFTFDLGVLSNYYFAIFSCTSGGVWNTSDSAPRFQINYISFATVQLMLRSNISLSVIGLSHGGVVNIQTSTRFPDLRWKLVDDDYKGCEFYDNTRTKGAIFLPQYLLSEAGQTAAIMSQFDAPELTYAITDDTVFSSGKKYYKLESATYTQLVEGTDWTAGDSVATYTQTTGNDVYTKNHSNRISYGNNNWKHSNRRQMLNSSGSNYFQKQNIYDKQSTYSDYTTGFLSAFDPEFLELIMPVYNKSARNTIALNDGGYGGGTDTTLDKFWLPSITEIFGSNNNGVSEGLQFAYFRDIAVASADRIQYDIGGTARSVFLRSANTGNTNHVYYITTSGTSSYHNANYAYAVRPAMCIA